MGGITGAVISSDDATSKVKEYADVLTGGGLVGVGDAVNDESGLYKIELTVRGNSVDSYMTKNGKLFFPAAVDLDKFFEQVESLGGLEDVTGRVPQQVSGPIEVSLDDDPVLGDEDAPIAIVEFSDFQCPFCASFRSNTFDQLKEEYIDTGRVKLVYRDFPLDSIHPDARLAAEASECADDQGKFWEYHDILFNNQRSLSVGDLKAYADQVGLDNADFNECLDSRKYKDEVEKDFQDGNSYGVSGTPLFFINGIELSGAQPFANFKRIIESELTKVQVDNIKEEVNKILEE